MTYDEFKQNFLPEFLNINSFAGKMKYADQNLQRIGSGSGRVVYDIDGEKVLKLAKNQKGIAQNEAEAGAGYYRDTQHIVTIVFENADDNSWLISEEAKKVNEKRIKELTGIPSLNALYYYLRNFADSNKGIWNGFGVNDELKAILDENEFCQDLQNFIANYGQSAGDMGRPSTYGEVLRDGQPTIVLTDYGLNDEVYNTHYSPNRKKGRYQMYELYNYADGNDDILSDIGDVGNDQRHGMWAIMPYSVDDGQGVMNEEFINFVSNRNKYPDKPINGLPVLSDNFHECVNNLKEVLNRVGDKKKFYHNLLELQNYLTKQGYYDRDQLMSEEYSINEVDSPKVINGSLGDKNYSDKLANEVAIKLNLPQPRYLGGGANGFAYEIDANNVMKITADISEADAASKLMRGKPKYIAAVYHLYKVIDTDVNKAFYVIIQENIIDKPLDKFRRAEKVIELIKPFGIGYGEFFNLIKIPKRFNYDEVIKVVNGILTENPESNVSEGDRQEAYKYFLGLLNIRRELLEFEIKSTDYTEIKNLGYKNGVLKYFDAGGYTSLNLQEPNLDDSDIITLPENLTEEQLTEDYDRKSADVIASRVATKMGLPQPRFLGAGYFGVAYDIGDNKVLKITKDSSEANENLELIGRQLKYIAEPYNVFEVTPKINDKIPQTFAIILEKLETNPEIQRMYKRLEYAFEKIMDVKISDVIEYYLDEWDDGRVSKEKINSYLKKNPRDAEFFGGLVRIAEEAKTLGIESMDYLNPDNLGYKKNGALGFFDVGWGNFLVKSNVEKIEVEEDGSAKFSTDNAVNQDDFPPYDNTADTSPSINNDLDANIAMYEDLEYNHVKGDATEDKYMLSEEVSGKYYRAVEKNMGETIEFEPEGYYEAIDDDGNPTYKYDTFWESDTPEVAASKSIGGAVMGLYSMFMQHGRNPDIFYIYEITEKPDVDISHWDMGDFAHLKEVRYRRPVQGTYKGKFTVTDDVKKRLNAFYEMYNLEPYDEPDEEIAKIFDDTDYDQYLDDMQKSMSEGRQKAWMSGSKAVTVKKKCQLGGNGDGTSTACNQGDINNLEFSSLNEVGEGNSEPYPLTIERSDNMHKIYSFITEDDDKYYIEFDSGGIDETNKMWMISFGVKNDFGEINFKQIINKGRMYRIMATILKVIRGFFANTKPDILVIEPIKTKNQYDDRRFSLYLQYIEKNLPQEYEMTKDNKEILIKRKEVNEYYSSLVPEINEGEIMSLQDLPFKQEIEELGGKIYSVGGAVRDKFLGKESKDLDVLITGIPMDNLEQLLKKYGGVNSVGKSFGVIKFVPKGSKEEIDIAIPRTEVATGAGGHQGFDVKSDHELPIEKDLERRDFTINAIANDTEGNLIDPFGGQEDLKNKIIRIVNPEAFSDDPLRMLRAVQFASRFGFTIEPKTMQMIVDNAAKIKEIAAERILIELDKIIKKGNPLIGVQLLASTGLFKQIFGNEIKPSQIGRRDFAGVKTMAEFLFLMMNGVVQDPAEFYLTRFSTEDAKRDKTYKEIQALAEAFNSDLVDPQMSAVKARSIAYNMYKIAPQTLESQILPEAIQNAGQELLQGKYPKTVNDLAVNGNDLMQKGLQGKAVGDMQKSMLIRIFADKVRNTREDLLSLVNQPNDVEEGYPNYSDFDKPYTWNVGGKQVDVNFFVNEYDKWNHQSEFIRFTDPSRESVLRFLEDEYEGFVNDEKLKRELYWKLIDRELLNEVVEKTEQIEYGALMLFLDIPNWNKITSIIKKEDIYELNGEFGIETEPHVTILYGFHKKVSADDVFNSYKEHYDLKPIGFKINGISIFESKEFDVVKIDVESKVLSEMNKKMRELPSTITHPVYHAHITLAYVKKGKGKKYVKKFEKERVISGNELVFSTKNEKKSKLKLNEKGIIKEEVKRVSYSAVVLDDKSRTALIKVFKPMIPNDWEVIAHHMTIKMGGLDDNSKEKQDMVDNTVITLNVVDYAMDNMVMAVGVEGYPTTNKKSHITIAVNRKDGGKPFMSNKLTDWKQLGFPLKITGSVNEE